ncbi:MAG: pyridoxal phosphate-dependent aminotransferase [Gemmatimonadota bacterium]|nr:pyridoxal phosphate-dependent aminotransferase [Gemmatimonadota bacterium]MDP6529803.1 pyridoxal phosphate-dependent aminotransferase [Gemmatimonadota bacterium]MDP6801991.1 pyridoxal phosphate-dependent aminotransferase [Gemmatimonadota bacterium]MDP7031339.1 pyridoxal phosphate-dependent aminotransferase [Gemmatimonadota bacterium]
MRRVETFRFMHWAKRHVRAHKWCLGASGMAAPSPEEYPPSPARYGGPNFHGLEELRTAVAGAYGADLDGVLVTEGTSLANYAVLATLAGPGDRVLVETPTYPPLHEIPRFHGAAVERIPRRPENGWQPSLAEVERATRTPVAAVVLTRLHNPTGADLTDTFLTGLAELAAERDFRVLLDEVFLDFAESARPGFAYSPNFFSTASLTKVYGFGGLRVGWVLGNPEALAPVKEFSFYLAVDGSHGSQATGVRVLADRESFRRKAREAAMRGTAALSEWIESRDDVSWVRPAAGINAFLRLRHVPDTASFAERLSAERGVVVAGGEHFGQPGWVRVSVGGQEETVRGALHRLGEALDERRG